MRIPAYLRAMPFLMLLLVSASAHAAYQPARIDAIHLMGFWQFQPPAAAQQAAQP